MNNFSFTRADVTFYCKSITEEQVKLLEKKDLATLSLNNERKISGLEGQVSCLAQATNTAIAGINNTLCTITKTVVPKDAICPEYMPRYNSRTAPTAPTTAA